MFLLWSLLTILLIPGLITGADKVAPKLHRGERHILPTVGSATVVNGSDEVPQNHEDLHVLIDEIKSLGSKSYSRGKRNALQSDPDVKWPGTYLSFIYEESIRIKNKMQKVSGQITGADRVVPLGENYELIEGDILVSKSSIHRSKRQVISNSSRKWTDNTLVYKFDSFTIFGRRLVHLAMNQISSQTCIKFKEDNNAQGMSAKFIHGDGCNSEVGMSRKEQPISIGAGCFTIETIVHEIMHALGVNHIQTRYDRDEYVFVNTKDHNFKKQTRESSYNHVPYEYGSVMHYGTYFPSKHFGKVKMIAKQREFQTTMGSHRVSLYDMKMLNIHYGCGCKRNLSCLNGGYTNPAKCSECICPSGYGGPLCNNFLPTAIRLTATSQWQSYTSIFEEDMEKLIEIFMATNMIVIEGAPNRMIEVQIMKMKGFVEEEGACVGNGVELKTMRDQVIVNPVVCNKTSVGSFFRGEVTRMPILFYNRVYLWDVIFGFRYRLI